MKCAILHVGIAKSYNDEFTTLKGFFNSLKGRALESLHSMFICLFMKRCKWFL